MQIVTETISLLQVREVAARSDNNVTVTEHHLNATRTRYKVGELTQTDVSQAVSRTASARAEQLENKNKIRVNNARFEELTGGKPPKGLTIPLISKNIITQLVRTPATQVEGRPDLAAAMTRMEEADLQVGVQKAGHLPVFSLSSDVSHAWDVGSTSKPGANDSFSLSLGISLPIYSGGSVNSKMRQAISQKEGKQASLDLLHKKAIREIQQAIWDLESAQAVHNSLETSEAAARQALAGVGEEFRVGTRSSLDLLDAQSELFSVQKDLVKSRYAMIQAQYQLLKARGRLSLSDVAFRDAHRRNPEPGGQIK